jgi:hypothetical protein
LRSVVSGEGSGAGSPELWLNEYSWDAAADRVARVLGADEANAVQRSTDVELEIR